MKVTGLSADTFWKGETEIRGEVTDGTERYRVRIRARVVRFLTTLVLVWIKMGSGPGIARWAAMEKEEAQSSAPTERLYMEHI